MSLDRSQDIPEDVDNLDRNRIEAIGEYPYYLPFELIK
jgi:hypothetical protein